MQKKYRYAHDYKIVEEDGKQKMIYVGPEIAVAMDASAFRRAKVMMLFLALAQAALYLTLSVTGEAMRTVYLGLPYVGLMGTSAYLLYGSVRFMWNGTSLERRQYEHDFFLLAGVAVAGLIFSTILSVGNMVWLMRASAPNLLTYAFSPLAALYSVAAYAYFTTWNGINRAIASVE